MPSTNQKYYKETSKEKKINLQPVAGQKQRDVFGRSLFFGPRARDQSAHPHQGICKAEAILGYKDIAFLVINRAFSQAPPNHI